MSGSNYFHAMFVNEMVEHDKDAVIISGVNNVIFSKLLQFVYSGEIDVNEDNCEELLLAADMFSIFEVMQACCKFLKAKLQPENCTGLMYIVGGSNDLGEELNSVECFIPDTRDWVTLADLNMPRSHPGVAVLDDCLYAVGEWNEQERALKSVEKLEFEKGVSEEVSPMSTARSDASVVAVNNMIYVMGRRSDAYISTVPFSLNTVEGYDPATDTLDWTWAPCLRADEKMLLSLYEPIKIL